MTLLKTNKKNSEKEFNTKEKSENISCFVLSYAILIISARIFCLSIFPRNLIVLKGYIHTRHFTFDCRSESKKILFMTGLNILFKIKNIIQDKTF